MEYKEVRPDPALQPYIQCFWYAHIGGAASDVHFEVLPNLFANVFLNLSGHYVPVVGDQSADCRSGQVMLVGARTKLWRVVPQAPSQLIGIKFNPGGLYPFLNESLEATADQIIDLSASGGMFARALQPLLAEASMEARLAALDRFFLDRLPSCPPLDAKIQRAVAMITQRKGQLRIEELAREVDVSKRSLERYFLKHVGLSPKAISQIIRLRQAIEEILHGSEVNLGEVAFNLGFYDRSHLFNEIKDMMGKAPSAVAQSVDLKWNIFVTQRAS